MIDRLIDVCSHRSLAVLTAAVGIALLGVVALTSLPVDALPEIGDRQIIVRSEWARSPDLVDQQVTYPIATAFVGMPNVKSVRGVSEFGTSFVYVILDERADLGRARQRAVDTLAGVTRRLPEGVKTEIGPDATSLGWVFQYVLVDPTGRHSLSDLRAIQDWQVASQLRAVEGVAEIATLGGFVREYQISVDPARLRAYHVSVQRMVEAVKGSNRDVGGGIIVGGGGEMMVRARGQVRSPADLAAIRVGSTDEGTPILVRDVGQVTVGSQARRGAADLDGTGEVVSGIVVMRRDANALDVVSRVKERLRQVEASLPDGVEILPVYDRSVFVRGALQTLVRTLVEITITVTVVLLVFLGHVPSVLVAVIILPMAILIASILLERLGVGINIMSLGGLALAMGALVDSAIVVIEQVHKRIEEWERHRHGELDAIVRGAIRQVARPSVFAMFVMAVSFLPVLVLQGESGQLFRPLAYAKTFAVLAGALLTVTLVPALRRAFVFTPTGTFLPTAISRLLARACARGAPEETHWLSGWIIRRYEPAVRWSIDHARFVLAATVMLVLGAIPGWYLLGTELLPRVDEQVLLYMPSTVPGIPIAEAERLLTQTDRILKAFPEVERVLGKAGRAETATDPAPLSMLETIVVLRPKSQWPRVATWYSSWAPEWMKPALRVLTSDVRATEALVAAMNDALVVPGVANAWSMPIRGRVDMLNSGVRTPVALRISGNRIEEIERLATDIEAVLAGVSGIRSAFAERSGQGTFLDIEWNREQLARAGLDLDDAQMAIEYAVGGDPVTTLIDGRARYPVSMRYASDFKADVGAVKRLVVFNENGRAVPIESIADVRARSAPAMLRSENGTLTGYVFLDLQTADVEGLIARADARLRERVSLPDGYTLSWTGEYESLMDVKRQLRYVIPLSAGVIVVLLYVATRSASKAFLILMAIPGSAFGAVWLLYGLGYHLSAAVWIGFIALLGVDASAGMLMLLYLDEVYDRDAAAGRLRTMGDLRNTILEGAARRVRPKFMTMATLVMGLLPVMWSSGVGSEIMKRIAAPVMGGIVTSLGVELFFYPVFYFAWKARSLR